MMAMHAALPADLNDKTVKQLKVWLQGTGLNKAICAWAHLSKDGDEKELARVSADLPLDHIARAIDETDAQIESVAWLIAALERIKNEEELGSIITKKQGNEPEYNAKSYKDWYGCGRGPYEKADYHIILHDHGEAESKAHYTWAVKGGFWRIAWTEGIDTLIFLIKNPDVPNQQKQAINSVIASVNDYLVKYNNRKINQGWSHFRNFQNLLRFIGSGGESNSQSADIRNLVSMRVAQDFDNMPDVLYYYDIMLTVKNDPQPKDHHFSYRHNGKKRQLLHQMAEELGLHHISEGMDIGTQEGKKKFKRAAKNGEEVVKRHLVIRNFQL